MCPTQKRETGGSSVIARCETNERHMGDPMNKAGTIRILEPVARGAALAAGTLQGIESLKGKTVGLLSNEWRCVKILFEHMPDVLTSQFGAAEVIKEKVELSLAGPEELLDDVALRTDAVIVAMAN